MWGALTQDLLKETRRHNKNRIRPESSASERSGLILQFKKARSIYKGKSSKLLTKVIGNESNIWEEKGLEPNKEYIRTIKSFNQAGISSEALGAMIIIPDSDTFSLEETVQPEVSIVEAGAPNKDIKNVGTVKSTLQVEKNTKVMDPVKNTPEAPVKKAIKPKVKPGQPKVKKEISKNFTMAIRNI